MIKLNIQRFASTNQTPHYDLSQYVANDKPTYLVDYNQDMSKIDTAIYDADSRSLVNESAIGTMSNLNTTDKSSLVGAINEVNTQVGTNTSSISTLNTQVSANTGNIGVMANLDTTDKTNLVGAINEVDNIATTNSNKIGNISNLETVTKSDLVSAINEVVEKFNLNTFENIDLTNDVVVSSGTKNSVNMTVAKNNDGSIAKIYGNLQVTSNGNNHIPVTIHTSLRPSEEITFNGVGLYWYNYVETVYYSRIQPFQFKLATNGDITFTMWSIHGSGNRPYTAFFSACLLFIKDFGDVPSPQNT